jgi:hypothetical protein
MKTKAKSVQVFELRLWSKKHYGDLEKRKDKINIYDGFITNAKTKEKVFIDSAGDLLKAIETMYNKSERGGE